MDLLTDENVNPIDGKGCALLKQGLLSEKLFLPDLLNIKTEPLTDTYSIEPRPFARGKFATVRRCRHKLSGQDFAAKCIRKRRRAADVRHEILHEVCVLKLTSNNHKRIVRLHEVFETPTEIILVLEMLSGGELQRLIDDEISISESDVARLIRQVLEGLDFLHERNIAHLDIKPQNILLTSSFPQCDVKLCDFGISRMINKGIEIREIVGTPDYVAPEVLHYDPICLATDMWSMGILTYVLLTGHTPFGGDTKQETFLNITNGHLDFPKSLFSNISKNAKDFIGRLLIRETSERMTTKQSLKHPWLSSSIVTPSSKCIDEIDNIHEMSTTSTGPLIHSNESTESLLERCQRAKASPQTRACSEGTELMKTSPPPLHQSEMELELNRASIQTSEHPIIGTEIIHHKLSEDEIELNSQDHRLRESRQEPSFNPLLQESFQEVAIIPLEALLQEITTNHDNALQLSESSLRRLEDDTTSSLEDDTTSSFADDTTSSFADDTSSSLEDDTPTRLEVEANNLAIRILPEVIEKSSTGKVLTEYNRSHQQHQIHLHLHNSTSTVIGDRQSMKTKIDMVEFEDLALSKRLIFSEEITMVDERMGMVY